MKKHFILLIILVMSLLAVMPTAAQEAPIEISIGEAATGFISNEDFEDLYLFEAEAGDIIIIAMTSAENADLDGYLYLTTPDNNLLAENDDFNNTDPRIVHQVAESGTYQIVATRFGERTGSSEGGYTLILEQARVVAEDTTIEGRATVGEGAPIHVILPDSAGTYTLNYQHIRGDYFPSIAVYQLDNSYYGYSEPVAMMQGQSLQRGQITFTMELGIVYMVSVEQYGYNDNFGAFVDYTLRLEDPTTDE